MSTENPLLSDRVRNSYFNILAFLLSSETVKSSHVRCLLRWGLQLNLKQEQISMALFSQSRTNLPGKLERLEAIYHLVYLINHDTVVEDVELEVASLYAVHLGFPASIVSDLFRAVATAGDDGLDNADWRTEVMDFLRVHNL